MSVSLLLVTLGIIHRSGVAAYLRRAVGRLALVLPLASTIFLLTPAQPVAAYPVNIGTFSRYLTTTDAYSIGCNQGQWQDANGQYTAAMILDFGHPDYSGQFGADMYGGIGFRTGPQIEATAERAFDGFYNCTVVNSRSFMHFAIGTTNCTPPACGPSQVNYSHGQFWEGVVNDLNNYLYAHGYQVQEDIYGASDIETGWSYPSSARSWVDGFKVGPYKLLDFGVGEMAEHEGTRVVAAPK